MRLGPAMAKQGVGTTAAAMLPSKFLRLSGGTEDNGAFAGSDCCRGSWAFSNLTSTGTLRSDSNRIAAGSTVAGPRFINSTDNDWNVANGTNWYANGSTT